MRSTPFSLTVVVAIFCAHHVAHAQYTTSATCSSTFDWAVDQQRSPCLVAAYVQGACSSNGAWEVPALPSLNTFYNPPMNPMTECGCSIASYNLLSACAACQGASSPRFPFWINNCSIANLLDTSTYYPTSKWPIADGVQIPLWAQEDARLWTNMQFNSTEARQIAASGNLIGPPLTPASTTSPTATSPSSPSSTSSAASPNDNHTDTGAIVGGVVGGVLGLLLVGVLIWWIMRHKRPSFEDANPNMPTGPAKGHTPALVKMVVPIALRPPRRFYPSSLPSPTPTSNGTGTGNAENSSVTGALGHSGTLISYPYNTTGIGPTFTPPSMASSSSVGRPSNEPQRMGSSRSMIARFVFPRGRTKRNSDAPSTLSQGSSRMSQMGILQSPTTNVGHLPPLPSSSPVLGPIPGPSMLEPTPYMMPPLSQGSAPSSYPREKVRINPPGYTSPEATIPSTTSQPISAVHAHTIQPLNTDINRMIVTTPDPMGSPMPDPPSYVMSQAEIREEQLRLRRAVSNATAGTLASSSNVLPSPSTPERRGGPLVLASVPESATSPPSESDYPPEKV